MPTTPPTPQVTYAGVPLLLPDERLQAHLDRHWRPGPEWRHPGYTAPGTLHLPRPYQPEPTRPRLGVLHWPHGLSLWATYHALVTDDLLKTIRTAMGSGNPVKLLILSDGERSISTSMQMLPPRPISQGMGGGELYMLTLVDWRYNMRFAFPTPFTQPSGAYPPATGGIGSSAASSWSAWFSSLFGFTWNSASGEEVNLATYTLDAVPSAYKTPSYRFAFLPDAQLVALADGAATAVGARIVRNLDGTIRVIRPENARSLIDSQYTQYASDKISGGKVPAADLARCLPDSATVVFPPDPGLFAQGDGGWVYVEAGYSAVTQFSGLSGQTASNNGNLVLLCADLLSTVPSGSTPSADQTAYATQSATDWYYWRTADVVASYRGVVPWQPTGMEGAIEWSIGLENGQPTAETRISLPSYGDNQFGAPNWRPNPVGLWMQINSGTDSTGYAGTRMVETSAGVWSGYPVGSPTAYSGVRRPPSNSTGVAGSPPDIPVGQVVEIAWDAIMGGWSIRESCGGLQKCQFTIYRYTESSGSLIETPHTVTIQGRDLTVSVS